MAILVQKHINYTTIDTTAAPPNLAIEIPSNHKTLKIIAIYHKPQEPADESTYGNIFNKEENKIILGDLNAHSTLWHSKNTTGRGKIIEKLIEENDLIALNDNTPTYIHHTGTNSILDLAITSANIAHKCSISTQADTWGSDHYPILLKINEDPPATPQTNPKWNLAKADWEKYKTQLDTAAKNFASKNTIQEEYEQIQADIIAAAQISIPKTKAKPAGKPKPLPYWNDKIKEKIQERNHYRNQYNKNRTQENRQNYNKAKAVAQRTIKDEAKEHWQQYCNSLDNQSRLGSVWRQAKNMTHSTTHTNIKQLTVNGQKITSEHEQAEALTMQFQSTSADQHYDTDFRQYKQRYMNTNTQAYSNNTDLQDITQQYNTDIQEYELDLAIRAVSKDKAPGQDDIPYEMIQNCPQTYRKHILNLYNNIWKNGELPTQFTHSIILPFLKEGKDPNNPASYRPISLTSCLCKLLERILTDRLTTHLEKHNLLNPDQAGFRKGRSTIDQIVKLKEEIIKSIKNKGYLMAVFIDFEKAFDLVWREGLLTKLKTMGIQGRLFTFIENFTKNRTIQTKVGNSLSTTHTLQNGTPPVLHNKPNTLPNYDKRHQLKHAQRKHKHICRRQRHLQSRQKHKQTTKRHARGTR